MYEVQHLIDQAMIVIHFSAVAKPTKNHPLGTHVEYHNRLFHKKK